MAVYLSIDNNSLNGIEFSILDKDDLLHIEMNQEEQTTIIRINKEQAKKIVSFLTEKYI